MYEFYLRFICLQNHFFTDTQVGALKLSTSTTSVIKCTSVQQGFPCKTVAYTTNNNKFAQRVMDYAISSVGLTAADTISLGSTEELRVCKQKIDFVFYTLLK